MDIKSSDKLVRRYLKLRQAWIPSRLVISNVQLFGLNRHRELNNTNLKLVVKCITQGF